MKRAGFTMIELIFVIVILGILSAVALPKFIGVSEQAQAGKCEAFIGTLNRTTFPAMWADMLANDYNETVEFTADRITAQIEVPAECGTAASYATAITAGTQFTVTIGASDYNVSRIDAASSTTAPRLGWGKLTQP